MNYEPEHLWNECSSRGADPALRVRVLDAVAQELTPVVGVHWFRWAAAGVAASLFLGVALNYGINQRQDERMAAILGPTPTPRAVADIAQAVEFATDKPTAQWAEAQMMKAGKSSFSRQHYQDYIELIRVYAEANGRSAPRDEVQTIPENRGDPRRRSRRGTVDYERGVCAA